MTCEKYRVQNFKNHAQILLLPNAEPKMPESIFDALDDIADATKYNARGDGETRGRKEGATRGARDRMALRRKLSRQKWGKPKPVTLAERA